MSGVMPKGDTETFISSLTAPICLLSNEQWSPQGEGTLLDLVLDNVLSQLQPVCLAEQAFCISFLHLDTLSTAKVIFILNLRFKKKKKKIYINFLKFFKVVKDETSSCSSGTSAGDDHNSATSPGSANISDITKLERQVNEQVRATMGAIFPTLETELNNFISFLEKIDTL